MLEKIRKYCDRLEEINDQLYRPETLADGELYKRLTIEASRLEPFSRVFERLSKVSELIEQNEELLSDDDSDQELREMAKAENEDLVKEMESLEKDALILMLPVDPRDEKNVILEIRAGTGGDEAALFVADMYRMYKNFASIKKWKWEDLDSSPSPLGGLKEVSVLISGAGVFQQMKFEAGTHRVQRIPKTETQGRIHTSAVTVAVLPEADEVDIVINPADLLIDTYRAQGAGGQHVNTTDSAVRITHVPSGIVVTCQEERSQIKNRDKAMKRLQARLYEAELEKNTSEEAQLRKDMVGSGDRSERIRTYNYPQDRITDHRNKMTLYKLEDIMRTGDMTELIDSLRSMENEEKLKSMSEAA